MPKEHHYTTQLKWTGNKGNGTAGYTTYLRDHEIKIPGKPVLACSADPTFRGDPSKYNPEEMLLASLSGCHMLWYLHLCSENNITVIEYSDTAEGVMEETTSGKGHFTAATLHPVVSIAESEKVDLAITLHNKAHDMCFIANSVNFSVDHKPVIRLIEN
jgi:organic hydroperoxide reductase OsmC/OhrA